jgi:2-keto-4-pentenoate hydratase/2-oxohepta-3-ene-1,7-dioic acid hydratase in catechol pathway
VQLFQTTLGPARRAGDELIVLDRALNLIELAMSGDAADAAEVQRVPLSEAVLLAPTVPAKIVIVGKNSRSHLEEVGQPEDKDVVLGVFDNVHAASGPGAPIVLPVDAPERVDYEGEVVVVIGRIASNVDAADAWSYIAGVTAGNDVSARDVQLTALTHVDRSSNAPVTITPDMMAVMMTAKSFPSFKPLGPGLITGSAARGSLSIRTTVNGQVRQDARMDDDEYVFTIPEVLAAVSKTVALQPGDVIFTGSPAGIGEMRTPAVYLVPGDVVEVYLGDLPPLCNQVADADPTAHGLQDGM